MNDIRPSEQCPNCCKWVALGSCYHSSSGPTGTLYGVCEPCAKNHAAYSYVIREIIEAHRKPKILPKFDAEFEAAR